MKGLVVKHPVLSKVILAEEHLKLSKVILAEHQDRSQMKEDKQF